MNLTLEERVARLEQRDEIRMAHVGASRVAWAKVRAASDQQNEALDRFTRLSDEVPAQIMACETLEEREAKAAELLPEIESARQAMLQGMDLVRTLTREAQRIDDEMMAQLEATK